MEEGLQQQMTDALNEQICDDNVQSVEHIFSSLNAQEIFRDLKKGIPLIFPDLKKGKRLFSTHSFN